MSALRCRITSRLHSLSWVSFWLVLLLSPLAAIAANLTGLSITPPNPTLNINDRLQLIATGSYDNGTQQILAQAKQVSAGTSHTCALNADGTIKCWGLNNYGQLGNGTTINSLVPVTVSGITTAVAVSAGGGHSCALLADNTLRCWGSNTSGQLGNGTTTGSLTPVTVSGIDTAVTVSAGGGYTCAVLTDGSVRCWGGNYYGQLGISSGDSSTPVAVSGLSNAVMVSAGNFHTSALLADGTVWWWGTMNYSSISGGTASAHIRSLPVAVSGISNAVAVSSSKGSLSRNHSCALLADGSITCWSVDWKLDGTSPTIALYVISGNSNAVAVSTGDIQTCVLLADGAVRCWGGGELVISNAVAVSAGSRYTCAVLADGAINCWGYNDDGLFGNGISNPNSSIPVTVSGISNAMAGSTGYQHTCAALADGTVQCWGANSNGQLGNGTTSASSTPIAVNGIGPAVMVSAGRNYTCAVLADRTLRCWGGNTSGQLGNGTNIDSMTPVTVSGINTAVAVSIGSLGSGHTCAALADGTLRCWGSNTSGQLGNGTGINSSTPVAVSGITTAVAVSVGSDQSCALLADNTLRCWGRNTSGQLGNGTNIDSMTPVTVSGINTAVAVSAGGGHTCAALADGTLRCWGSNYSGQLGNGMVGINSSTPVTVSGITTAVAVSAGSTHTCAALADGTLRCWGRNEFGQLGNGTTINSSVPVTVSGITTAVAVVAGYDHTCAALADGTLRCWGRNEFGQLGNGISLFNSIPTPTLGYAPIVWSSNDPAVASVNGAGQVQALALGKAQITASAGDLSASTTVRVIIGNLPVASDLNTTAVTGASTNWTPIVSDPDGYPITCRLGMSPTNGTATIASNCSSGTYQSNPGFIGTDTFTYLANDGQYDSNPGTVTVAVT